MPRRRSSLCGATANGPIRFHRLFMVGMSGKTLEGAGFVAANFVLRSCAQ
jgi:hypothetical protein